MKKFPNNPDGEVLNLMRDKGADFSKEHGMDFFFYFREEKSARIAKERLEKKGFEVEISQNAKGEDWLCVASIKIIPGYHTLISIRKKFERLARELDGEYDGWGALIE